VSKGAITVYHRSLPHGDRDSFPGPEDFGTPEDTFTVICMREPTIAYRSSLKRHNRGNKKLADECTAKAKKKIKEIMGGSYPFTFFDYEAALFLR